MDLATARTAGVLARQRDAVAALIETIDAAIATGAPIIKVEGAPNADGSGNRIDLLPFGFASLEIAALVWQTARDTYAAQLADLETQLAAL